MPHIPVSQVQKDLGLCSSYIRSMLRKGAFRFKVVKLGRYNYMTTAEAEKFKKWYRENGRKKSDIL